MEFQLRDCSRSAHAPHNLGRALAQGIGQYGSAVPTSYSHAASQGRAAFEGGAVVTNSIHTRNPRPAQDPRVKGCQGQLGGKGPHDLCGRKPLLCFPSP